MSQFHKSENHGRAFKDGVMDGLDGAQATCKVGFNATNS